MSDKMVKVEFYGANGYCLNCKQPLEGKECPYCGWEDKNPPQFGYTKKSNTFVDFFAECEKDPEFRREYLRASMEETKELILENKMLRQQLGVAKEALKEARMELGNGFHLRLFPVIDNALAEIARLEGTK